MHDHLVRHISHAHLRQETGVAEKLVFIKDLIDNFLRTADHQSSFCRTRMIKLLTAKGRPASFPANAVHHRRIGRVKFISSFLGITGNINMGIDTQLNLVRFLAGFFSLPAIQVYKGYKLFGGSANNGEREGKPEFCGPHRRCRCSARRST